jgi:hypothetical protein
MLCCALRVSFDKNSRTQDYVGLHGQDISTKQDDQGDDKKTKAAAKKKKKKRKKKAAAEAAAAAENADLLGDGEAGIFKLLSHTLSKWFSLLFLLSFKIIKSFTLLIYN